MKLKANGNGNTCSSTGAPTHGHHAKASRGNTETDLWDGNTCLLCVTTTLSSIQWDAKQVKGVERDTWRHGVGRVRGTWTNDSGCLFILFLFVLYTRIQRGAGGGEQSGNSEVPL